MNKRSVPFLYPAAFSLVALFIAPHFHAAAAVPLPHGDQYTHGLPPLHAAAYGGDVQVIEALVEHGRDIHALDSQGETVLFPAADQGHHAVISYAIAQGVAVNHVSINGVTALSMAITYHHFECVRRLIEEGHAAVNLLLNFFGHHYTALDLAHEEGAGDDIRNLLVVNGAHHSAEWLALHANDDN